MPNDITFCSGVLEDESICPLADHCKRFLLYFKRDKNTDNWYVEPKYDGMCENFIETFPLKKK